MPTDSGTPSLSSSCFKELTYRTYTFWLAILQPGSRRSNTRRSAPSVCAANGFVELGEARDGRVPVQMDDLFCHAMPS